MQLLFDTSLADGYTSSSQKARILTEDWVGRSVFCPNCGRQEVSNYENNRPVADFHCLNCLEQYELKSKNGIVGKKIVDGAYSTMIERLGSSTNPNFFMLSYDLATYSVKNFLVVPKHFFIPEIIEKRKPLSMTARRAGWVGCNILLNSIPESGKVYYVRDGQTTATEDVLEKWQKTLFLREEKELSAKGWLLDVMRAVDKIGKSDFTLEDVYAYEGELARLHPENNHVKDKIRQQLQVLRDKNYIDFVSRGKYHLI
jgi:type II restriction enzyme